MDSLEAFFNEDSTLNTKALIFALWQHRANNAALEVLVDVLIKYVTDRKVFDAIEFYLPQITHMLIHGEVISHDHPLERLVVVICQSSVHTALHVSFILFAALEDYQPEDTLGRPNPCANNQLFVHCARIMRNVERAVVQGDIASFVLDRTRIATLSSEELAEKEDMFRTQTAADILKFSLAQGGSSSSAAVIKGPLMFKRVTRQTFHRKTWKTRWFRIEDKVLMCYHDEQYRILRRTLPLQDCHVDIVSNPHHENCFDVQSPITGTLFKLQAETKEDMLAWIEAINAIVNDVPMTPRVHQGAETSPLEKKDFTSPSASSVSEGSVNRAPSPFELDGAVPIGAQSALALLKTTSLRHSIMSALEKKRYKFFIEQRMFISKLTDICEELRFIDRSERQDQLRSRIADLEIPKCCYLALGNSTHTWSSVLRALPQEVHAFSTKARCPALLLFEMRDNIDGLDVATFLGSEALGEMYEDETTTESMEVMVGHSDADHPARSFFRSFDGEMSRTRRASVSAIISSQNGHSSACVGNAADNALIASHRLSEEAMQVEQIASPEDVLAVSPKGDASSGQGDSGDGEEEGEDQDCIPEEDMESFASKTIRLKEASPLGSTPGWRLDGLIAKSNDDLRQEVFVMQLITFFERIFKAHNVPVWLLSYRIVSTSKSTGMIQLIPDAISLDGLKKGDRWPGTLRAHFEQKYGPPDSTMFKQAMDSYIKSLAGYSVVTYILAIKDRHNGNVMIDTRGHLIHIDFGFVFGLAPGKQFSMETAPWKLTEEMVDVMGGLNSPYYEKYVSLTTEAFKVCRQHTDDVVALMEIMSHSSCYPAFKYNPNAIADMRKRMMLDVPDENLRRAVDALMARSYRHTGTGRYDQFQVLTNGIAA